MRKDSIAFRQKATMLTPSSEKDDKKVTMNASMTMEEKINRMRSNQAALARVMPA
jgi:hypothetical protein